jgi:hypothetical protein
MKQLRKLSNSVTMSGMIGRDQRGALNSLLLPFILALLLLIGAVAFGAWAYSGKQDYKNNVDQKIGVAVTAAKQQQNTVDNQAFAEAEKQPLTTYNGPQQYGSLVVKYPKTWSSYVDSTGTGNSLVDGYFDPGTVPAVTSQASVFALRIQVVNQPYSQVLQNYNDRQQSGLVISNPYKLPMVPSVIGVELTGQVTDNASGTMVILPLRSNTLEIWTQGTQYLSDFNQNILPNFSFSP